MTGNMATVSVLAHQAHTLLALSNDRTAITTDAYLLFEEASARIELLVSGASGQVEVAERIRRLIRFGSGRFDDASVLPTDLDIVDLNSLLRVVTSLKRLYSANEQIAATENFIRLSARIQRLIKLKYINQRQNNLLYRLGQFTSLCGTTYVDFATDNGISITRLFEVIGAWWVVLTISYGIVFMGTGMPTAGAAQIAATHAAAVLVFYPEATGVRSLADDPTTRKFAEAMRSVCITSLPDIVGSKASSREDNVKIANHGGCLKLSFLNAMLNFFGRVISITHISLIASILFRRIMYRAN
jgi:hypothetical protein